MVHVPYEKAGATYADLEALPPNLVGEIVSGRLIASPRPAPRHGRRRATSARHRAWAVS